MPEQPPDDPNRTTDASSSPPVRTRTDLPARIGRYEVRKVLGEGAYGRVYLAVDRDLDREVAIKVPLAAVLPPELRQRFLLEASATARIRHPNVCSILDLGTDADGAPFLVMEFVPGGTLEGVLKKRRKPYSAREAADVLRRLALGVAAAHAKKVLHRDLKPANVLWDEENQEVKVTDFGLARVADAQRLSTSGAAVGTPLYMSPEQWRGKSAGVGEPTDVYSLGVMLYELATGTLPFAGETVFELMVKVTVDPAGARPPSEVRPGLDPRIDELCARAMAKEPADRYPSAKAFADALAGYLSEPDQAGSARSAVPRSDSGGPGSNVAPLFDREVGAGSGPQSWARPTQTPMGETVREGSQSTDRSQPTSFGACHACGVSLAPKTMLPGLASRLVLGVYLALTLPPLVGAGMAALGDHTTRAGVYLAGCAPGLLLASLYYFLRRQSFLVCAGCGCKHLPQKSYSSIAAARSAYADCLTTLAVILAVVFSIIMIIGLIFFSMGRLR